MKNWRRWMALALLAVLCCAPLQAQAVSLKSFESFKQSYSTCSKGDTGLNVQRVKTRLKDLGYYTSSATYDDEFNDIMVDRLKEFQRNNGLRETGRYDLDTMEKLNGGGNLVRGSYGG